MGCPFTKDDVKQIKVDGKPSWKVRCPGCEGWATADDDQMNGRVSMDCPNCSFHETHDLIKLLGLGTS